MPITHQRAAQDTAFDHCLNAIQRHGLPEHQIDRDLLVEEAARETGAADMDMLTRLARRTAQRLVDHAGQVGFKVPTHPADVRVLREAIASVV